MLRFVPYHEPRSYIFKRNVIGQIARLSRHKKSKWRKSVRKEVRLTFVDEDDNLALEKCGKHKGKDRDW